MGKRKQNSGDYDTPRFLRISSIVAGEESCIFCDRPTTGHLITEFERGVFGFLRGIAISVCQHCENHRKDRLATDFESTL